MKAKVQAKPGLHPRNRHRERYDFPQLVASCPELAPFVADNAYGDASIDFADPAAVRTLNKAILKHFYGIQHWDLPPGYLCPPIPGRADYLHYAADLLASSRGGAIPRGAAIRVLDLGVGANCVYPLLGHREYGWHFLGSDVDPVALAAAQAILKGNPGLEGAIQLRLQPDPGHLFEGLVREGETFALCMSNPPFHASAEDAQEGSQRKWKNLGRAKPGQRTAPLNFGGRGAELWCPGGEAAFVGRMIAESAERPGLCQWFTSLVSREANLPGLYAALKAVGVREQRTLSMAQGQKRSRMLAWTY